MIGEQLVCDFKLAVNVVGVESDSLCMTNRPAILKWYLVGLDGDGN